MRQGSLRGHVEHTGNIHTWVPGMDAQKGDVQSVERNRMAGEQVESLVNRMFSKKRLILTHIRYSPSITAEH